MIKLDICHVTDSRLDPVRGPAGFPAVCRRASRGRVRVVVARARAGARDGGAATAARRAGHGPDRDKRTRRHEPPPAVTERVTAGDGAPDADNALSDHSRSTGAAKRAHVVSTGGMVAATSWR